MLTFLLFACSPVQLRDNTELNLDASAPASLATPYLLGASFELTLSGDVADFDRYRVRAVTADVLSIGAPAFDADEDGDDTLTFPTVAVGEGTTELSVVDGDGREVLRTSAEVFAADRFEVRASTDIDVDANPAALDAPKVFVGGTSSFRLDFFHGNTALSGAGGVTLSESAEQIASVDTSSFLDDENWIVVEPVRAGERRIEISTGGEVVGGFVVQAVEESEVAGLAASRDSESGAETGDGLTVVAWGEDSAGERIYGVPFTWEEDGVELQGSGDTFQYSFDESEETALTAVAGEHVLQFTIHGHGQVSDSNTVGCVVANVGPIGSAIGLALVGIARRRRGGR